MTAPTETDAVGPPSRPGTPWGLLALTAVTVVAWLAVALLAGGAGAGGTTRPAAGWWQSVLTVVASALTLVLAVWLPPVVVRRGVPARWRALTASVGAVAVLALGGWLAVLSLVSLPAG